MSPGFLKAALVTALLVLSSGLSAESSRSRMLSLARQEWEYFGRQTINAEGTMELKGHREADEGYWQRVGLYWRNGCYLHWTGKDTDEAWSAAFISWVMRESGLADRFHFSEWHAHYINQAIEARAEQDERCAFWGYRLKERAPEVGDMVAYARQDDIDFDHRAPVYKSHCDLVVAVRPGEIDVIGGNVQDSVTLKRLKTDSQGLLVDGHYRWFAVLANRLEP